MSKISGDINREMLGYAEKNTGDCYGDGTVYRGAKSKQFNKGFYAGLRHAALVLELEHKKVKDHGGHHNYYGVASQIVRKVYMEDLSEQCTQTTDKS